MGYFNFHHESKEDPRIAKLCRSLRIAIPYGLGHLACLRSWASSEQFRAFLGDLAMFTPEQLASASLWGGDIIEWAKALIDSGMVIRDPSAPTLKLGEPLGGCAVIADWIDICGEATKRRIERNNEKTASDGNGHASDDWWTEVERGVFDSKSNNVFKLLYVYKYIKLDKNKEAVKTNTRWDKMNGGRQMHWCKEILKAYEGDLKKAAKAVFQIGEHFEGIGCNWDCATVHKWLSDWENGKLNK